MYRCGPISPTNTTNHPLRVQKYKDRQILQFQSQSQWVQWCKFNKSNIESIFNMYSTEKVELLLLKRLPDTINDMLNKLPLYEWPCLLIVFYGLTERCNNDCCNIVDCGMYHNSHRKKKHLEVNYNPLTNEFYVWYLATRESGVINPSTYKSIPCLRGYNCKKKFCSFYHDEKDKFNINNYDINDLIEQIQMVSSIYERYNERCLNKQYNQETQKLAHTMIEVVLN